MKTTKYAMAVALGLIALAAPSAARADTIFTASGTFQDNSTLSGTLTINTITGLVTSADLIVQYNISPSVTETFTTIIGPTGPTPPGVDLEGNHFSTLFLVIAAPTLMGYTGGALCSTSTDCAEAASAVSPGIPGVPPNDFLTSGKLTAPVSAAPEPSIIALLGTGLLGLMGAMRRMRSV